MVRGRRPRSRRLYPRRIVWPMTDGSLLSTSFQKRCVNTTAPAAPWPSSAGVNSRPSTGRSPITSKNDPLTTPALTRRGSLAEPDQREIDGGKIAEGGDGRGARLEVIEFGDREGQVLDAETLGGLADIDQPIRLPIDERTQKHAPNHTENRRVGADAQGERHHHRDGQALARTRERKANRISRASASA